MKLTKQVWYTSYLNLYRSVQLHLEFPDSFMISVDRTPSAAYVLSDQLEGTLGDSL